MNGRSTGRVGRLGFARGRAHVGATAWRRWAPGEEYNACFSLAIDLLASHGAWGGPRNATGMTPSSCSVERSLSRQKYINSLMRSRLTHEKVAKLILAHTNFNLLGGYSLEPVHMELLKSVVDSGGEEDDWSSGGSDGEGGVGGSASD